MAKGRIAAASLANLQSTLRHGAARKGRPSREYRAWVGAKGRCFSPTNQRYALYGGRGITMSDAWAADFQTFLRDMGPCPPRKTLERKDKNGPYSAENCIWATHTVQMRNTRRNRYLVFRGESRCVSEWAEIVHIDAHTIQARLKRGWSVEDALTTEIYQARLLRP